MAIGQNEDAAVVLGVPAPLYKALAYSLSAFLPALAGGLYFFKSAFIQPSDAFDLSLSTEAMVIVMLGGRGTITGAAIGAYLYEELRGWLLTSETFSNFQLVVSGVLAARHRAVRAGRAHGLDLRPLAAHEAGARMTRAPRDRRPEHELRRAARRCSRAELRRRRAGDPRPDRAERRRKVDRVQPDQRRLCARCRAGEVRGADITGEAPYRVARHGLARTHQIVQPLTDLTVLENCTVGACFGRENLPLARARAVAREVAVFVGLEDRLATPAAQLTIAGKKRLELARALAAQPLLLLLDEVLAGLNPTEIERMLTVIRSIRERGVAILIIEHLMQAIMGLSDRIVVLNSGQKLAEGTPAEIANNPAVIEAYLGDPALAEKLHGGAAA